MKRSTRQTLFALLPPVLGGSAIGVLGLVAVRWLVPQAVLADSNDVIGNYLQTLGGIYAVLLAFVVVIVWQQFNEARANVEREANEVVDLFRTTRGLPAGQRERIASCLARYVDAVLQDEWPVTRARSAHAIDRVGAALDEAYGVLLEFEPGNVCHQALHAEALARFNDLSDARTMRLTASHLRIPRALRWLLYMGGAVLVASTWMFAVDRPLIHAIVTGAIAGSVSHVLYVVEDLDNCFGGDWQIPREALERARNHVVEGLARSGSGTTPA